MSLRTPLSSAVMVPLVLASGIIVSEFSGSVFLGGAKCLEVSSQRAALAPDWVVHSDDYPDLQSAINAAAAQALPLFVAPGVHTISQPLQVGVNGLTIQGAGQDVTKIKTTSNISCLMSISAAEVRVEDMSLETTGTTARCIQATNSSLVVKLANLKFFGDNTDSLVYSQSKGFFEVFDSDFEPMGGSCWGLVFDSDITVPNTTVNQNCSVTRSRFGDAGNAINIRYTGGRRVEGIRITNVTTINQGVYGIKVDNSLRTLVASSTIDQAASFGVFIGGGADSVEVVDCYIGEAATGLFIDGSAGSGHAILGNDFNECDVGIMIGASATQRVTGVRIHGNRFSKAQSIYAMQLDSVARCVISGNIDDSHPYHLGGSVTTLGTHPAHGSYTFSANIWDATRPFGSLDSASTYVIGGF